MKNIYYNLSYNQKLAQREKQNLLKLARTNWQIRLMLKQEAEIVNMFENNLPMLPYIDYKYEYSKS